MALFSSPHRIILLLLLLYADGVRQCDPGRYGESCDRSCAPHCAPMPGSTVWVCDKDTGRCYEGCVPGWHGDHCSLACSSSNCLKNVCSQDSGHCILGCKVDYLGDFCSEVFNADGVRECVPGHYGKSCDRSCAQYCAPMPGSTVGVCDRDTGRCYEGCLPGWHGVHCSQACSSSNCLKNVCSQADGRCILGCKEKDIIGLFCTKVFNADGVIQCVPGHYGKSCDKSCPPHCAPKSGSAVRDCDGDSGRCYEGCVPGWHGDLCSQACSSICIDNVCNQDNGHCTKGCTGNNTGDFCTEVADKDPQENTGHVPLIISLVIAAVLVVLVILGILQYRRGRRGDRKRQKFSALPFHGDNICECGLHGDDCNQTCPENCRVNPVRNLTHCQRKTGRCSDRCKHGWYGHQCDHTCSRNCPGNVCNQRTGHCTNPCDGKTTGDFWEITKDTKVLEEEALTAAQKIRKRTESRIQSWTKDMVETEALQKVTDKLDRGATWVTIKGRPGEGKSTTAYMALKDQHLHGKQVYQVVSPEEFNEVITACADPVIMLDDIFGDLEFDASEWTKWRTSLQPVVDVNDFNTYTEPKPREKSAEIPKGLERTKGEQTPVKRTGPNKGKAIIILVGRDYVLKSLLPDLGRMADYISSPQYVVEVTSQRDVDERKKIWHVHAKTKHIDFDESTVSRICQADCPYGFPHVCKMFVTAYEHGQTQDQAEAFFQSPLKFLTNTMEKFLQDEIKRSLFMAMIKGDGKISGQELEEDPNLGYKCITAADDLVGSYLKKEDGTYVFDHPSIYDSVALILSTKQPKFVIENCSLTFIHQRIRLKPSSKSGGNVAGETDLVANIPWTCARQLARRFATEIERSNLLHVLSHQACCIAEFVELLMDCVKTQGHMSVPDILKLSDKSSRKSFCELLPSNKSFHLIKYIIETENVSFSQSEIRDILHGVCMNAACSVLTYLSQHMKLDINGRYGFMEKTPLMLAAQTQDSKFVNQILSLDPDLYARDYLGQTVFHYLCEYGLTSAVESTINMGVDVKKHYMPSDKARRYSRHTLYVNILPLYIAIQNGHVEVVQLLVRRGCEVDNQECLRRACKSHNMDMVHLFLDRGAQVDGDAVFNACEEGDLSIISMLFDVGASVNMVSSNGYTPLHSSCGYNPKVVSFLLEKGASVNYCSNVTGDTPLHKAAGWGSTECVDMLLKAGADVHVQNNEGDTPLHAAAGQGSTDCVHMLLKAGADVNVQNNAGDTPLHNATAALLGSTECVDLLLKAGADVKVQNNEGDTPLHAAAGQGSTECVDMLLKAGADVKVQNNTGDTPLHNAAGRVSQQWVDVLLKSGAEVKVQNNTGDTPLHTAAALLGYTERVDMLLKAGADVNVQNNTGDTPLHTAAAAGLKFAKSLKEEVDLNVQKNTGDTPLLKAAAVRKFAKLLKMEVDVNVQKNTGAIQFHKEVAAMRDRYTECVDMLLKAGADVKVQNNEGDTPLHNATAALLGSTAFVHMLQKAGADVNVQNNAGDTPLHTAAGHGSTVRVDMLLKAGADVKVQNNTGDTPIHTAAGRGSTGCVDLLLKAGADVNVQNNTGDTPLHKAAGWGSTECVDMLLKAGADVKVQNNTGDTPLHTAAALLGSTECVDMLQKAGADVNVQNTAGDTPLHKAAGRGSTECVDRLLKAGADVNVQNNTGDTPLHSEAQ